MSGDNNDNNGGMRLDWEVLFIVIGVVIIICALAISTGESKVIGENISKPLYGTSTQKYRGYKMIPLFDEPYAYDSPITDTTDTASDESEDVSIDNSGDDNIIINNSGDNVTINVYKNYESTEEMKVEE